MQLNTWSTLASFHRIMILDECRLSLPVVVGGAPIDAGLGVCGLCGCATLGYTGDTRLDYTKALLEFSRNNSCYNQQHGIQQVLVLQGYTLVSGVKSWVLNYKPGTDTVNAFRFHYTWFKIQSIKGQKSSTGHWRSIRTEIQFDFICKVWTQNRNVNFTSPMLSLSLSTRAMPSYSAVLTRCSMCHYVI